MLAQATQRLITTARNASAGDAELKAAAQFFFDAARHAGAAEANSALAELGALLGDDDGRHVGFVAIVCGAMVERGCDPAALDRPLRQRLQSLLEASARFADACVGRIPPSQDGQQDPTGAFEAVRPQVAATMPGEAAAWDALKQFWCAAIALDEPGRACGGAGAAQTGGPDRALP